MPNVKNIQALLFKKAKYDQKAAKAWLKKHKLKPIKPVHITGRKRRRRFPKENEGFLRYRILQPDYKKYIYRTKKLPNNIELILQYKK